MTGIGFRPGVAVVLVAGKAGFEPADEKNPTRPNEARAPTAETVRPSEPIVRRGR